MAFGIGNWQNSHNILTICILFLSQGDRHIIRYLLYLHCFAHACSALHFHGRVLFITRKREQLTAAFKCSMIAFQVSKERGEELAIEYGIKFMETSAKASINVEEAFFTLARDIKAKMEKKLVRQLSSSICKIHLMCIVSHSFHSFLHPFSNEICSR